MRTRDTSTHSTSSLKVATHLVYQGARLQSIEPAEPGRYRFILVDVPAGALHTARDGEQIELRRWLSIHDNLRTILTTAARGGVWRP